MQRIGIMAAVHGEIAELLQHMDTPTVHRIGMRDYHEGILYGKPCVVVLARMGKVAAAATAVTLVREFNVDRVIFTGLAGGLADCARVGDIVVGTSLLQHDLDARPLFPRHEIPLLGRSRIDACPRLSRVLAHAARNYLQVAWCSEFPPDVRHEFHIGEPRVHTGAIISGDQFISSATAVHALRQQLPDALCVEMEGAAVAQVCHEYGADFAVIRTVSDRADENAGHDFDAFLARIASRYSSGILLRAIRDL